MVLESRLDNNDLCGLYYYYDELGGTYTAEGIIAISEALKVNRTLQSVRCDMLMLFNDRSHQC